MPQFLYSRRYIRNNKTRVIIYLLISSIFFSFSALRIDRVELARPTVEEIIKIANPSNIGDSITSLAQEKETVTVIFSFYMHYGRLESTDPTANWRLDIWQDLYHYMNDENIVMTGHGYKSIFPIMLDPSAPGRLGRDGLNENVHKFVVIESTNSHSGNKKKLNFDIQNFSKFKDKIEYIVVDEPPKGIEQIKDEDSIEVKNKNTLANLFDR